MAQYRPFLISKAEPRFMATNKIVKSQEKEKKNLINIRYESQKDYLKFNCFSFTISKSLKVNVVNYPATCFYPAESGL